MTHVVVNAATGWVLLVLLGGLVFLLAGWLGNLYSWLAPKEEIANGGVGTLQVGGGPEASPTAGLPPCPSGVGQGDDQAAEGNQEAPAAGENKELTEVTDSHTFFYDPSTGPCDPKVAEAAGKIKDLYVWLRQAGFSHEEAEQYMANDTRLADAKEHREQMENDNKAATNELAKTIERRLTEEQQHRRTVDSVTEVLNDLSKRLAALEATAISQLGSLNDRVLNFSTRVALLEGSVQDKEKASLSNGKVLSDRITEINKAMAMRQGSNNERMCGLERSVELLTALTDKLRKKLEALEADARPPLPGAGHQPAAEQTGAVPTHQPRAVGSYGYALNEGKIEISPLSARGGVAQAGAERPRHEGDGPDAMITARAVPAPLQGGGKSDLQATLEYVAAMARAAQEVLNTRLHHAGQGVETTPGLERACWEAEQLLAEQFRRVCNSYEEPLRGVRCDVSGRKPTRG